jgi:hypothetical protein
VKPRKDTYFYDVVGEVFPKQQEVPHEMAEGPTELMLDQSPEMVIKVRLSDHKIHQENLPSR